MEGVYTSDIENIMSILIIESKFSKLDSVLGMGKVAKVIHKPTLVDGQTIFRRQDW